MAASACIVSMMATTAALLSLLSAGSLSEGSLCEPRECRGGGLASCKSKERLRVNRKLLAAIAVSPTPGASAYTFLDHSAKTPMIC